MAVTQEQVDAFEQAMLNRQGVIEVANGDGQVVRYEGLAAQREYLAILKQQLAGNSRTRYAATSKGF